jgi:putative ABC transport system permease protein
MKTFDYLRSARNTFSQNRLRVMLTLLGIIIGVGSIVLLASLLRAGQEALMTTSQGATEADLIKVREEGAPPAQFHKPQRPLTQADADVLGASRLLGGAPAGAEASRETEARAGGKKKQVTIAATAADGLSFYKLEMERGRFFDADDLRGRRRVCVVGQEVWRELFGESTRLREAMLTADGEIFSVVGSLKNKPLLGSSTGSWMWNRKVLVPASTYDLLYSPRRTRSQVFVRLGLLPELVKKVAEAEDVVERTLLRRHLGVKNFKLERDENKAQSEQLIFTIIKILLLGTGLLSLFVGGINIMNIMLVTVAERTREIGLRCAVGATPRSIMAQFVFESALIATVGGVLGVLSAILLSWLASLVLSQVVGSWTFYIEAWSIALGLGLASLTGICFGIFPAWRASRLDPVEALRSSE